ncbi:hypothetical protein B0H17DRAFT_1210043 [Mycena rosella]|uniref:Uncharacterized protein n=1 Tax=Mycena rosella TaxID=1033263 RepID=A0AAD7CWX8_MYCRO|nr:hypothetical protein B0H17DRAFT_1210043 [Mycena rosella]
MPRVKMLAKQAYSVLRRQLLVFYKVRPPGSVQDILVQQKIEAAGKDEETLREIQRYSVVPSEFLPSFYAPPIVLPKRTVPYKQSATAAAVALLVKTKPDPGPLEDGESETALGECPRPRVRRPTISDTNDGFGHKALYIWPSAQERHIRYTMHRAPVRWCPHLGRLCPPAVRPLHTTRRTVPLPRRVWSTARTPSYCAPALALIVYGTGSREPDAAWPTSSALSATGDDARPHPGGRMRHRAFVILVWTPGTGEELDESSHSREDG